MVRGNGNFLRTRYLSTGPERKGKWEIPELMTGVYRLVSHTYLVVFRATSLPRGNGPPATWPAVSRDWFL